MQNKDNQEQHLSASSQDSLGQAVKVAVIVLLVIGILLGSLLLCGYIVLLLNFKGY